VRKVIDPCPYFVFDLNFFPTDLIKLQDRNVSHYELTMLHMQSQHQG